MVETEKYGLLLAMLEPPEEMEEEFNEWYDTEHIPEREAVPGILSAQRYVAHKGSPRYLALYDLESIGVLQSEAYRRIGPGNFSPWTRRILRNVRIFIRNVYDQTFPGQAQISKDANALVLWGNDIHVDKEKEFTRWFDTVCTPSLREIDGFINARRFLCVEGSPNHLTLLEFKDIAIFEDEAFKKAILSEQAANMTKYSNETMNNLYKRYRKKIT